MTAPEDSSSSVSRTCQSPVAIFGFNRPDLARIVLAAVREARPPRLFLVCDAARANRPDEGILVQQTRDVFEDIDWPTTVTRIYAETNMGCRRRLQSGLDQIFAEAEEAIILEDDCLPNPAFFRFCDELLERYRHEAKVMTVAGTNLGMPPDLWGRDSYTFTRYPLIWGWACWRRSWEAYDRDLSCWQDPTSRAAIERYIGIRSEVRFWRQACDRIRSGYDTWDYQLVISCFASGGLTVTPSANLVTNMGFRADATHTKVDSALAELPTTEISPVLIHPSAIRENDELRAYLSRKHYRFGVEGWAKRWLSMWRR